MKFTLQQIAGALGVAAPVGAHEEIGGWSIDSRTLHPGDLFFALRGPKHDGHAHLAEVFRKGAAAAVVEEAVVKSQMDHAADGSERLLCVGDTLDALQRLATWARSEWGGSIVAVTGSAGKTTTKEIIAEMLSVGINTAKSEGNLNNHIGLPLSLLRLNPAARVAVMELGMNHAGEIRRLAEIARPNVGVVTNVGHAHVEFFASIEDVAAAKRELIEALPVDGIAVLNADDPRVAKFAQGHAILYGESPSAQVRAEHVVLSPLGAQFRVGDVRFQSPLPGRHNVSNILAGIAVAGVYGIPPRQLTGLVENLRLGKMRGERLEHNGITIYNDCYNSNPAAVRAMLEVLRDTPARKRIAVLGEMQELGAASDELHREVGVYAAHCGINSLIGIQGKSAEMCEAANTAGIGESYFFDRPEDAGWQAAKLAHCGDAILFKGSRAVRVELALAQFMVHATGGQN